MTALDVAVFESGLASLDWIQAMVPIERSRARCLNFAGDFKYRAVSTSGLVRICRS